MGINLCGGSCILERVDSACSGSRCGPGERKDRRGWRKGGRRTLSREGAARRRKVGNPAVRHDLHQRTRSTRSGASTEAIRSGVLDRGMDASGGEERKLGGEVRGRWAEGVSE